MSEDKAENIDESTDPASQPNSGPTPGPTPEPSGAPAPTATATETDSDAGRDADTEANSPADEGAASGGLSDLMASGERAASAAPASKRPARDLEAEALRAAEQALAESERALATARAQLREDAAPEAAGPAKAGGRRGREIALRLLLAGNVVAMAVVVLLPSPMTLPEAVSTPPPVATPPAAEPAPPPSRYDLPWNRAMEAADRREFATAITILEDYLADAPRMAPSRRLSVMMALSHYAARDNDFKKAREYQQRAAAIDRSHSLPEDLVAMAQAAADSGDQETLRRVWARFLLQQRQIPSWLYKHVAEAYLQLGDSYRQDAVEAAEAARLRELEATAERLREEAMRPREGR